MRRLPVVVIYLLTTVLRVGAQSPDAYRPPSDPLVLHGAPDEAAQRHPDAVDLTDVVTWKYTGVDDYPVEQLITMHRNGQFVPLSEMTDLHLNEDIIHWFHVTFTNGDATPQRFVLTLKKGFFWRMQVYEVRSDGVPRRELSYSEISRPVSRNAILPFVAHDFALLAGETVEFFVLVKSKGIDRLRPTVEPIGVFEERSFLIGTVYAIVFGILIGLWVYVLLLTVSLREREYVFFLVFHALAMAYILVANGFTNSLFQNPVYRDFHLSPAVATLTLAAAVAFSYRFLRPKAEGRRLRVFLYGQLAALAAIALLSLVPLAFAEAVTSVTHPLLLATSLFTMVALAIAAVRAKVPQCGFLLGGWISLVAGTLIAYLVNSHGLRVPVWGFLFSKGEHLGIIGAIAFMVVALGARVSTLRAEREELRRAADRVAVRSQFLAMVSHELRTPLTNIVVPLQEIDSGRLGESIGTSDPLFSLMRRQTRRLQLRVENLLRLAQSDRASLPMARRALPLARYLQTIVEEFSQLPGGREATLDVDGEVTHDPTVSADPDLLDSVFVNLMEAAAALGDPDAPTSVSLSVARGFVTIRIRNTGAPIVPVDRATIFDPVAAAGDASTRRQGCGLGPSVAKLVAEMHGGKIEAAGDGPWLGEFVVTLPVFDEPATKLWPMSGAAQTSPTTADPSVPAADQPPGVLHSQPNGEEDSNRPATGARILLVEDDGDLLALLQRLFEEDYSVVGAASAEDALRRLAEIDDFELIVSDIMMPGMDGIEFAKVASRMKTGQAIPLVFLTARCDLDTEWLSYETGAVDFVRKPFDAEVLRRKVANLVMLRRRLASELRGDLIARIRAWSGETIGDGPGAGGEAAAGDLNVRGRYGLTEKQGEVLDYAIKGYTNREIAAFLSLSVRTVESHMRAILAKTGVERRAQLSHEILGDRK